MGHSLRDPHGQFCLPDWLGVIDRPWIAPAGKYKKGDKHRESQNHHANLGTLTMPLILTIFVDILDQSHSRCRALMPHQRAWEQLVSATKSYWRMHFVLRKYPFGGYFMHRL